MAGEVEIYLQLIESQENICDRFFNIKRIDKIGGDGAHSIVFTAKDSEIRRDKEVVLKFFNPLLAENFYRRECFIREATLLGRLRGQRNILPLVKDLTVLNLPLETQLGKFTIQFSFYASHKAKWNLTKYIYSDDFSFKRSIRYFRQICKAVQRIHMNNIYHRDLKPGNFLIFPSGYVCISDFGSAKNISEDHAILDNYERVSVGDPRYTSFELLCSLPVTSELYKLSDFFSLGAILFELFSRNVLSNIVLKENLHRVVGLMRQIPESKRTEMYFEIINQVSIDNPLPSVRKIESAIPKIVAIEIDKLYKGLAKINYKERETDFNRIFAKINLCEKLIDYSRKNIH